MMQAAWNIKQWRKVQEPDRNKTHWDYMLAEMEWLSKDFKDERQWKVALAKKAIKAVTHQYVPLNNTFIINLMTGTAQANEL